jgi:hypothetical protein
MDMLNPDSTINISAEQGQKLRGIAFDGCFFYITEPRESAVHKYGKDFKPSGVIKTDRQYTAICFDSSEGVFWASTNKSAVIYKLDYELKETGQLHIKADGEISGPIIGLSYNCKKNTLLAVYREHIAEITKKDGVAHFVSGDCRGEYTAVLSAAPYYATACQSVCQGKKKQELNFYSEKGCFVKGFTVPAKYTVEDILFYPCQSAPHTELLILVSVKCGPPVILRITVKSCVLAFEGCNHDICKSKCGEDEKKPCHQACNDLLESVALVETALAHILNAEGEKLQKARFLAKNIDELLEVNKSVSKTLVNAAHLEFTLLQKLESISDICPNFCDRG